MIKNHVASVFVSVCVWRPYVTNTHTVFLFSPKKGRKTFNLIKLNRHPQFYSVTSFVIKIINGEQYIIVHLSGVKICIHIGVWTSNLLLSGQTFCCGTDSPCYITQLQCSFRLLRIVHARIITCWCSKVYVLVCSGRVIRINFTEYFRLHVFL